MHFPKVVVIVSLDFPMMTSQDNNSLTVENVPVFAFPTTLSFIENDKSSYKRILTIYNPYDFTVRFKGELHKRCTSIYFNVMFLFDVHVYIFGLHTFMPGSLQLAFLH